MERREQGDMRMAALFRAVVVAAAVLGLTFFVYVEGRQFTAVLMSAETEAAAELAAERLQRAFEGPTNSLRALRAFCENSSEVTEEEFREFTASVIASVPSIREMIWSDETLAVRRAEPSATRFLSVQGSDHSLLEEAMGRSRESRRVSLSRTFVNDGSDLMVALSAPVIRNGKLDGIVWALVDLKPAARKLLEQTGEFWRVHVFTEDGEYLLGYSEPHPPGSGIARKIAVGEREGEVSVSAKPALEKALTSATRWRIFGIGTGAAILAGVYTFLLIQRQARLRAALSRSELLAATLEDTRRRLSELIHGIEAVVWEAEEHCRRFTFVSDFAGSLLGYPATDWMAQGDFWLNNVHPDDLARVRAAHEQVVGSSEPIKLEYRMLAKDHREVWVRESVTSLPPVDGTARLRGVMVNITDRVQSEEAMRRAQKLESIGVLAGGIAHDFNNLLTAVMGHAELAAWDIPESSPAHASLSAIISTAERLAELTKQILAYSGQGRFVVAEINLNDVIRETATLLSISVPKNVEVKYDFDPSLPSIEADEAQMQQIVLNLLTNAAEAVGGAQGSVLLSTRARTVQQPLQIGSGKELPAGSYAMLQVTDNGSGMSEETIERIFDPFFTTKFTGRGLGLAAVEGIVRGHRGQIEIRSEPGIGTTFRVYLPASLSKNDVAQPAAEPSRVQPAAGGFGRILLVDDEGGVRQVAADALRAAGYEVLIAGDGADALRVFDAAESIDLVLMDLNMPRMSGVEAFRHLRAKNRDVAVILMSGESLDHVREKFGEDVPDGFLPKPFLPSTLVKMVKAHREAAFKGAAPSEA